MASRSARDTVVRPDAPTDSLAMARCEVFDYPPMVNVSCHVPDNIVFAVNFESVMVTRR